MKIFRLFALLTLGLTGCMGFAYAQTPNNDSLKDSLKWEGSPHINSTPYGRENARISDNHWDPTTETWYTTVYDTVCDEYPYTDFFGSGIYSTSGTYSLHYFTDDFFDSIVTLHLIVKYSSVYLIPRVYGCDSYTWDINGQTYTTSSEINYTLPGVHNVEGCDSILLLRLTINQNTYSTTNAEACVRYRWMGNLQWYRESGTYNYTRRNQAQCDSIMTLNLTIWHGDTLADVQNVCDRYTWGGNTYTNSSVVEHHFANIHGCDSFVTLNLTVRHSTSQNFSASECDSYTWRGHTYTSSNTYRDTIPNAVNCDSVMALNLTIRNSTSYTDNQVACDTYTWQVRNYDGSNPHTVGTYTSSTNTPTAVVTNKANCDSTIHLNLVVNHSNSSTQTVNVCDSYTWVVANWDGSNPHTIGTYTSTPVVAPTAIVQNSHGCDSTITLNLTIRHRTSGTDVQNHCDTYTWINGSSYTSSTNTPTHTLTNAVGCDSTVRLNLTIRRSSSYTDVQNHCDTYTWVNGSTYTASTNTPTHTLTNANSVGCDSNMSLHLTIRNSTHDSFNASECDSYTWTNHGTPQTFSSTGVYTNDYTNAVNCPSTDTLHLTIRSSNTYTDNQVACDSYTWLNGQTYTSSTNTPTRTVTNVAGCDSVITLNLTINATSHVNDTQTACYSLNWHGHTYTTSNTSATWTGTNMANCDSVVTLKLTIISYNTYTTDTNVCDAFVWNNVTYTSSTQTQTTLTNQWGCDSIDVLNLVVRHSNDSTETHDVCDSYSWHGNTYTSSTNTPVYNTTNHVGCDSTVYLHLTVRHSTDSTDTHDVCDRYTWVDGNTYTNSNNTAIYPVPNGNAVGCDSTVHLNLTIRRSANTLLPALAQCDSYTWNTSDLHGANHSHTYTVSSTYRDTLTNQQNCDSIVVLPLTIHYSFNTNDNQEACDSYTWNTSDANGSNQHTFGPFTSSVTQLAQQHTIHGCDSNVTLHLTVYYSNLTGTESANVCDSIIWNGTRYTTSGTYTYNTTTTHHCDSMATLSLVVRKSTGSSHSENVCDSYTWHAVPRTVTGTYTFVNPLANAVGCDSTETLNLVVRYSTSSVTNQNVCDSFHWDASNLTYTASNSYNTHLTNTAGCDSSLTLNLTVRHSTEQTIIAHGCDHYTWHGVSYSNDTNVDFHTTNAVGCDSTAHLQLTMDATINVTDYVDSCNRCTWNGHVYYTNNTTATHSATSVAGCDSITTLHLTIHHPGSYAVSQVACDSFIWAGDVYRFTSFPQKTFTDQWGCDSVVNMSLTIHHSDENTIINQSACDSYTWPTNGQTYTATILGETDTLQTSYNCDSIVTLNLTIRYSTSYTDVQNHCDSYTWIDGHTYTNSTTTPTHTLTNAANCDSLVTLSLTIRRSTDSVNTQNVCDSYHWDANNTTYTTSSNYYYQTTNAVGCDSNMTLRLTVRYRSDSTLVQEACDSYIWHENTYTASTNTPTFDTINAVGCDSTAHLHLTVKYSTTGTDMQNHCDSYPWHGVTYTASTNTPTYHTLNSVGCDSTATLNLTIRYSTTRTDSNNVCDQYTWVDGNTYTSSNNTAQWLMPIPNAVGCDSVALLNLTVRHSTSFDTNVTACDNFTFRGNTYTSSTIYPETIPNAVGCDSVITLYLTMDYTSVYNDYHDTCDTYTWTNGVTYTASTNTPSQHLYTVVGHCDSTSNLRLTIRYSSTATDYQSHCDSYTWPKNNHTYTENNDSDTAHLVNSQMCDSLVTLNLTIRHTSTYTDVHDICDSLVWHGVTYYSDNSSATYHTLNGDNCDSTVTLNLHVRYSTSGTDIQDICDSITWLDGNLYTANNSTAQAVIPNLAGCDSLVTLNLNVRYNSNTPYTVTECDMYIWPRNMTAYNHTQTALYNYTNAVNCPSTDTLHLTINNSSHQVFNQIACDTFRWVCHDVDTIIDTTGTYFHNYTNAVNCPSADTLHLSVNYNTSTGFHEDVCDSFTWVNHGLTQTYTASGTYYHDYNTDLGCPSTDTLYLNIRHSSHLLFDTTVCDLFHWDCHDHHQDYTLTGNYYHNYTNTENCPSADTLHLVVNHNTNHATTLTVCDSYTWTNHGNTMVFTTSGDYTNDYLTAENCPSTDTLHLTVNYNSDTAYHVDVCDSYTWVNHGSTQTCDTQGIYYNVYTNNVGCPSTDTLYLTLRHSTTYTDVHNVCDSLRWLNDTLYTVTTQTPTYIITNASGCDSIITLDLTVRYNSSTRYDTTACDSLRWDRDSILYPFSGTFTYNYTNASNCPSTDTLHLTIHYNVDTAYTDTACDLYVWHENHNTAYNHSGTFYSQPYNVPGNICNNIDTLYLTIYENTNTAFTQTACDTFVWNNHDSTLTYLVSGTYTNNYLTAENCPSTDTLHLTVNYNSDSNYVVSACDQYMWDRDSITYTFSTVRTYSYTNNVNCPSTDTLVLTIYNSTHTGYTDTACDLYVWTLNSTAYNQTGTYYRPYMNADSVCHNVDTLHLTVFHNTNTAFVEMACDTFRWVNHGLDSIYALGGDYTHDYLTDDGCPSTDTLHLSVNYNTNTSFTEDVCDSYTWINHGDTLVYDSTGVFLNDYLTAAGCPSTDTLHLTVRYNSNTRYDTTVCDVYSWVASADTTFTFRQSGTYIYDYTNAVNCPSTDTLYLTVFYNTDSVYVVQACEQYQWERDSVIYPFSGTFTFNYATVEGCPSIDTLLLTIDQRTDSTWIDTACDYYTWSRNRTAYNRTGIYTYGPYVVEGNVCHNYDTLKLTVYYADHGGTDTVIACDSLRWHGTLYTLDGNYNFDTLTVHGCDSTVRLTLTIKHNSNTLFTVNHACDSYLWDRDSLQFYFDTTGQYLHSYTNEWGCPSTDTLRLTVYYKSDTTYVDTACDLYTWHPVHDPTGWTRAYTDNAQDTHSYINYDGCPSFDSLLLTLYPSPRGDETYIVCDSILWRDGNVYRVSTEFPTDTAPSPVYCDSIITLHLTVNYSFDIDSTDYFCDSSSYIFHDSTIYTPGMYHYYGHTTENCDSLIHLDLIQLPKPTLSIDETHSCRTYEYTLSAHVSRDYNLDYSFYWYSEPEDLTLLGQEYDSTIVVHPVRNTQYFATVDYGILPTCNSTAATDTLVPIIQPHAIIKTTPPYVQAGDVSFRAEDKSFDYTSREWYLNGNYWGNERTFEYSAPASQDDSVALTLISISPTCADTAYLLVPIYNFNLYIPNIFTPTEPINKVFKVVGKSVGDFEIWIYTREGLLVYHSTDINEGWDGTHKGKLCHQAAYVYHVHYNTVVAPDAWHTATGTVMLIR